MKKQKNQRLKKSFCALSQKAAAALPRFSLECAERYELLLCGCRKIELYSQKETVLCTQCGKVRVLGEGLSISFTGGGKIMLSGVISAVEFI